MVNVTLTSVLAQDPGPTGDAAPLLHELLRFDFVMGARSHHSNGETSYRPLHGVRHGHFRTDGAGGRWLVGDSSRVIAYATESVSHDLQVDDEEESGSPVTADIQEPQNPPTSPAETTVPTLQQSHPAPELCDSEALARELEPLHAEHVRAILQRCDQTGIDPAPFLERIVVAGGDAEAKKRYVDAFGLYEIAADRGHVRATALLGYFYMNALGVDQNDTRAVELFQKAAAKGNAAAHANLGRMYELGRGGLLPSRADAEKHYSIAAAAGDKYAQGRLVAFRAAALPEPTRAPPPSPALGPDTLTVDLVHATELSDWQSEARNHACGSEFVRDEWLVVDPTVGDLPLATVPGQVRLRRSSDGNYRMILRDHRFGNAWHFVFGIDSAGIVIPRHEGHCPEALIASIKSTLSGREITIAAFARSCVCGLSGFVGDGFHPGLSFDLRVIDVRFVSRVGGLSLRIVGGDFAPVPLPHEITFTEMGNEYYYAVIEGARTKAVYALRWKWNENGSGILHVNKKAYPFGKRTEKLTISVAIPD